MPFLRIHPMDDNLRGFCECCGVWVSQNDDEISRCLNRYLSDHGDEWRRKCRVAIQVNRPKEPGELITLLKELREGNDATYKDDWESEYHDPISDEEERKLKEWEEQQNAEIMAEIQAIRDEEDAEERREMIQQEWERERYDGVYEDDLYDEELEYWSHVPLPDDY